MSVSVHTHFSQDQLEQTILGNPKIWKYSRKSRKQIWNIVFKWSVTCQEIPLPFGPITNWTESPLGQISNVL